MEKLKQELLNNKHWEITYNKMISKQCISQNDRDTLWQLKEIYKEQVVNELTQGEYEWSTPRKVEIAKHDSNKKRIVYIYNIKDRYILGVIYRALSKYYSSYTSKSCFSYKTDTSTFNAIEYIKNSKTDDIKYGVKIDIHAYFNSISRERVIEMINELFSGGFKTSIEKLMLNDNVIWRGQEIKEWKSIIPGCALGSFFANWCLNDCDKYFEELNCIYARYSDDIIILDSSLENLNKSFNILKNTLNKYGLTINPDKYQWFKPGDNIEYLGLKLGKDNEIDISDHSKQKIKKRIHRWCRKGRMEIERDSIPFEVVAKRIIRQINRKNFKCFIDYEESFGWCAYAFSRITTTKSLREIDIYTKDTIRAMKTGKHNKANAKAIDNEEFKELGWVSLVELYYLYKEDYDYYCEIIELI